jgi:hypothetical protein
MEVVLYRFLLLVFSVLIPIILSALSDEAELLKAAANGELDRVIDFVKNKGVTLTTKNNNGVRSVYS